MIDNKSGFTLVEFLVALIILTVGMLGLLQSVNISMDKNIDNVFRTEAVMLADDRMMSYRTLAYSTVRVTSASPAKVVYLRDIRGIQKAYSSQEIVTQPTTHTKQITVNITWKKRNQHYTHSLSSAISTY